MADTTPRQSENYLWYKDAVIYQVHVRSFYDSNRDGIGDFKGLIQKLDYIQSLGVNTLWLLPFYPSPLKDGGYDIADFTNIHPEYGSLTDFKRFVKEAHQRDLKIITELVLNHTSIDHKWFQRARKSAEGSIYRDFYVWSDTPEKYKDARIIFQDFEVSNWTYDHVAKAYYWHRFYSHQPDLNFENPRVQKEVLKILDFWADIGVDGFRLDAVPYLFESEGTNCENLPQTHDYLKTLRKYVDEKHNNKMLLAEANQWPNDSRAYFGNGDECHMAFHFPLMPRLYMALRMEDRFPIIDIMEQTPKIPEAAQWAIFLRNHDELTLEMVSDEERDYMYKSFAQDPRKRVNVGIRRRLFPLLQGDTRSIELINFLLFSMPGTPIVYYGDEIGMGDNYYLGDRDGVRTPMQWSPDKNAGFSDADPQKLFLPVVIDYNYHYTTVNVENKERNPSSFLWWKRRVIAKRKQYKAFGRGSIEFINTSNPKVLAFIREYKEETILVVVNLSRYSQFAELDLSKYTGSVPMEVFSRNDFPVITDEPWKFSMQFKNYFWFELRKPEKELNLISDANENIKISSAAWKTMNSTLQKQIKNILYHFILKSRWFIGNSRKLQDVNIIDIVPVRKPSIISYIFLVQFDVIEGKKDIYFIPLSMAQDSVATEIRTLYPESVIANIEFDNNPALLYDGIYDSALQTELFNLIRRKAKMKGLKGEIEGSSGRKLRQLKEEDLPLKHHVVASKRSNISVNLGDRYFLKMYRSPQEGENPDVEILKNLTRHTSFESMPAYVGRLDYKNPEFETTSISLLSDLIPNVGDAWEWTQTSIESFFDKVLSEKEELDGLSVNQIENFDSFIGPFFLEMTEKMGKRVAEMHTALSSITEVKGFEPEDFSLLYQKSLYQSLRTLTKRHFGFARSKTRFNDKDLQCLVDETIKEQDDYFDYFKEVLEKGKILTKKIRIHGNLKLDKLLFTGKDFMITDFEGEFENQLSLRKLKHCPLKDVGSLLSSFHYAIQTAYIYRKEFVPVNANYLRPLVKKWYERVSEVFLSAYIEQAKGTGFVPADPVQTSSLLNMFIFEKAVREIAGFIEDEDKKSLLIPLKSIQRIKESMKH